MFILIYKNLPCFHKQSNIVINIKMLNDIFTLQVLTKQLSKVQIQLQNVLNNIINYQFLLLINHKVPISTQAHLIIHKQAHLNLPNVLNRAQVDIKQTFRLFMVPPAEYNISSTSTKGIKVFCFLILRWECNTNPLLNIKVVYSTTSDLFLLFLTKSVI